MQTKFTLFIVAVAAYLSGLFLYASNRAVAGELVSSLSTAQTRIASPDLSEKVLRAAEDLEDDALWYASFDTPVVTRTKQGDPVIVRTIHDFNEDISPNTAHWLARQIERAADRYDVDPLLVTALISQESRFDTNAVSPVGALGLGQLMPYTAADLGVDPHDPVDNLDGCVRYLAQNLDTWAHTDDPVALALASYNAGPGAVSQYGGIPPYEETLNYVDIITYRYDQLLGERYASTGEQPVG